METQNETTTTTTAGSSESSTSAAANANPAASSTQAGTGASGAQTQGKGNDGTASSGAGATSTEQQAAQTPAYTPNFKFKVKDKELDFDDLFKPLVKDKDTEAKIREMHEKAHGIEEVKTTREQFKQRAEQSEQKFAQVETSLKTLGGYLKSKDYNRFFDVMQIPKDDIINYAIQELKYRELPPEQRQVIDAQRQQQTEFEQAQMQNQTLQQQLASLAQQQLTMEMDSVLSKPEVAAVATAYDTRMGKPGSFKSELIKRGQYYEVVHKISPPASQLVEELLTLVGAQTQGTQTLEASSQGQSGQTSQAQQHKPVIPAFQSGGAKSPTRKVVSSIDDLRKLRQQTP